MDRTSLNTSIWSRRRRIYCSVLCVLLLASQTAAQDGSRIVEIETSQVTGADVAVSPDGTTLVFTMLGHLFEVSVDGGEARQITSGPYYHSDPAFSPDGSRLAFDSNRDGNDSNIFVLDRGSGSISQLTHEPEAVRPAWSPDGETIAYISVPGRGHHCPLSDGVLKRVSASGGRSETIPLDRPEVRAAFYLHDGALAWAAHKRGTRSGHTDDETLIQSLSDDGSARLIRTITGIADRMVVNPGDDGFYARVRTGGFDPEYLSYVAPDQELAREDITSVTPQPCFYETGNIAAGPDGHTVYLGDVGRLWRVDVDAGTREVIPFRAKVQFVLRDRIPTPGLSAPVHGGRFGPRSILTPVLSPDGRSLVFGAAGRLWRQELETGRIEGLLPDSGGYERDPAFSPDGQRLAYAWSDGWRNEIRVLDIASGTVDAVAGGSSLRHPSWGRDGTRIVFAGKEPEERARIVIVGYPEGERTELQAGDFDEWSAHPQFGPDGRSVFYAAFDGYTGGIAHTPIDNPVEPAILSLSEVGRLRRPTVSPDVSRIAFRRNAEIWLAALSDGNVDVDTIRKVSDEGGDQFAFTPSSDSIIYSAGDQVHTYSIADGATGKLDVPLELERSAPEPLLIRRIRLLDFESSSFSPETSVLIEDGRIRAIGSEDEFVLPSDVTVIDAEGRFAIPGLVDLHAHIQNGPNGSWLAYGVTTVRDVGGDLGWVAALADRSAEPGSDLPRLFFTGDILHGVSTTRDPINVGSPDEGRKLVRQFSNRGVHFIKTHAGLTWEAQRAVMGQAHDLGLPVVEHAYPLDYLLRSVTAGGDFLEHMLASFNYRDDVLQLLKQAGSVWTPTLAVSGAAAVSVIEDPEHWVDERLRNFVSEEMLGTLLSYGMTDDPRTLQGLWRTARLEIGAAWEAGVKLGIGTDAPIWMAVPGVSVHWEMAAMVDAGIRPAEVLRMATEGAARSLGADEWLGSLEVGKVADIVLLSEDPLEDIRNSRSVWRVVKGGGLVEPGGLGRSDR